MITLAEFRTRILRPGLTILTSLGGPAITPEAEQMLLTIAQQESGIRHRAQVLSSGNAGPARGWWQFEQNGGVAGVMEHSASRDLAKKLCDHCLVRFERDDIWRCLEGHDVLAAGFARLLLWTDPRPLPVSAESGWDTYISGWRPGRPHRQSWNLYWNNSKKVLQ